MEENKDKTLEKIRNRVMKENEERYQRLLDAWKNRKPFRDEDDIPSIPVVKEEDYNNIIIPNIIRCGGIPKSELEIGKTYIGSCRNASEARWDGEKFIYSRVKFGYIYEEKIDHFEVDTYFDVFVPIRMKTDEELVKEVIDGDDVLVKKGKKLSFLLRHDKDSFDKGLIDENGWRDVSELIDKHSYTKQLLDRIVETNDKKRYEYNDGKTKIRARQGHSIPVNVELKEVTPPDVLYHGTATRFVDSIFEKGIVKGTRLYVHLSKDFDTALKVGERHGESTVLLVDAKSMHDDGIKFYLSNNGVYLTEYVDSKYVY